MSTRHRRALAPVLAAVWLSIFIQALASRAALANPVLGFVEEFPGVSTSSWSGGSSISNPGSGGFLGAADGYLLVGTPGPYSLGTVSFGAEYAGNWLSSGIQIVKVFLNDVGPAEPLEIHFSIGNGTNFWQYKTGFFPPHHSWAEFDVDLSLATNFTQILGSGTFVQALASVDRIHFRHDRPPFVLTPDPIQADVGIDHIVLANFATAASATSWGRIKRLYR
jgi:hypothetical protein